MIHSGVPSPDLDGASPSIPADAELLVEEVESPPCSDGGELADEGIVDDGVPDSLPP